MVAVLVLGVGETLDDNVAIGAKCLVFDGWVTIRDINKFLCWQFWGQEKTAVICEDPVFRIYPFLNLVTFQNFEAKSHSGFQIGLWKKAQYNETVRDLSFCLALCLLFYEAESNWRFFRECRWFV
jgi:hypothetical protein